ncbi:MAG: D-alanyl-D-alanine carboxypeptidase/D-alanyl-D-alanine-endopeptidase [Phycisphaerales bacterium]|nr:D-alanyl-D-alanine carboxypeptidase/D-alanyl-D-alanine-endopeptidase [Phycisphaerales bacterium]
MIQPTTAEHRRRPSALLAGVFALVILFAADLASAVDHELQRRIERIIREADIGGAAVGVHILDLQTGRTLSAVDPTASFIPASNMKLLTTGAAIASLGPEYQFTTRLYRSGDRLVLQGSGDPSFADPALLAMREPPMSTDDLLEAIAKAAAKAEIGAVRELVVDDRVFDREMVHPLWPSDQLDRHYCAAVGGVNIHRNVLEFFFSPGAGDGALARYAMQPESPWLTSSVEIRARTVTEGGNRLGVIRNLTRNQFQLIGSVRTGGQSARVALHDVPLYAGQLMADRLRNAGVRLESGAVRLAEEDEHLPSDRVLAIVTTPIGEIISICNKDSVNLYAEALLKRLAHETTGKPGSWHDGAAVMRMIVTDRLGPAAAAKLAVSDGSGLSRANTVTPDLMTAWLASMHSDRRLVGSFLASIPTVGEGTLRRRFQEVRVRNEVRAKSGTISGVRCLSGYIIDPQTGRTLAFSVLVNELPNRAGMGLNALRLHEQIVAEADRWLTQRRVAEVERPESIGG